MIFDMLRCRAVDESGSLLQVDQRVRCFEGDHAALVPVALLFLLFYTIGIPAFLFYKLTSFKSTILGTPETPGNPDYVELAPIKPLFQFFKPSCYRFEVYFWVEKVVLINPRHSQRSHHSQKS